MTQWCPSCLSPAWAFSQNDDWSKRERKRTIPVLQVLFQILLMPYLLTFHWSNQVIWLPRDLGKSMIRGFSVCGERVKIWLCLECTTDHFLHRDIMIGLIFNWIILSILSLHGEIHTYHEIQLSSKKQYSIDTSWMNLQGKLCWMKKLVSKGYTRYNSIYILF